MPEAYSFLQPSGVYYSVYQRPPMVWVRWWQTDRLDRLEPWSLVVKESITLAGDHQTKEQFIHASRVRLREGSCQTRGFRWRRETVFQVIHLSQTSVQQTSQKSDMRERIESGVERPCVVPITVVASMWGWECVPFYEEATQHLLSIFNPEGLDWPYRSLHSYDWRT